jgi:rhamnose utilization protein RhaD (predicted bifunctional aldolase and dehydrogenase)/NAD(P)-dependent dehydrogenase (short-subunit alcohol dehydrogenase family)
MTATAASELRYLEDRWDEQRAKALDDAGLLQYRSNLLGADLRITNFGGGNTSSKIEQNDPLDGAPRRVLWVKGSGGDLGSIERGGFATLYLDRLHALAGRYRGVAHEDEMVDLYPLCAFGRNGVAASIDTPLHGFLPFAHVDHLHPDWAIALAAAANGREKLDEFNRRFHRNLIWLPWQRPGFELGMMMRRAVEQNPGSDGVILGGHGLFTWGETQRECYRSTISVIDQLGQFVQEHVDGLGDRVFGGALGRMCADHREIAIDIFPYLRGRVSAEKRMIGSFTDLPEVRRFVNSADAARLAFLGTSCPDHFVRTKIRPLYVPWDGTSGLEGLKREIDQSLSKYRGEYAEYYAQFAQSDSPGMRDPNPTVVLVPGLGMFSFGKSKMESRITGEFYVNAVHVMEGATALGSGARPAVLPQAGPAASSELFQVHNNYVSLPPSEAFRIEYWALEEAKLRRQPPEKELSRQIAVVVGGGSGIGREVVKLAASRGAHVAAADRDAAGAAVSAEQALASAGKDGRLAVSVDIRDRAAVRAMLRQIVENFGGIDILINTAAVFATSADGSVSDEQWAWTLDINVTANHRLVDEAAKIFAAQGLEGCVVLTSSANAVVAKRGSEAYDVSKAALSHLVRELAVAQSPQVRVNGVSPATVVKGSTMFPRDRVRASLAKYKIPFEESTSDEDLRNLLARFYAQRTLTHKPIEPEDCANAILFLAGPQSRCTSGHLFPVDGGLPEAFLR